MLYILFIFTILIVFFTGVFRTGNKFNPLTYYIFFWGIWSIVSMSNPFSLNEVSSRTYLIIWLHMIFTSLGFLILNQGKMVKRSEIPKVVNGYDFLLSREFMIIQFVVSVVLIYFYRKYNFLLGSMSILDSRRIVYEQGLLFGSSFSTVFYNWIIIPIVKTSILLLISNLILNGKKNLSLLIAVVNCMLFSLIGGGRFIYFEIIFFAIISFGFKYDMYKSVKVNFSKGRRIPKIIYVVMLIFAVYFMNLNTVRRLGINSPTIKDSYEIFKNVSLKQLVIYFTGPFRALDVFLNSRVYEVTGYTFGRSFLSGFEEILNTFFIFVSRNMFSFNTANNISSLFTTPEIVIGNNVTFNAFYTALMNFYLDGGIAFVIVLSFVFGLFMAIMYKYYLHNVNILSFSLLVFMVYQMVATEFRWNYSAPWTLISIAIILLISYRQKNIYQTKYF
ncbi:O-antigen polymerase [Paenibacillus etheri]|uniref:Oligosaccharide repeat unit polymerase n=1 Tax=Paenibacillus etheri TaxID=1306852 RepID=A0A0W1B4G7_9BACL|nr:O-antigen polymerase [Paenibacillus etheri]KTD88417.1 hypothetical protein UQ64_05120 [Paenibacillus etheri]